MPSAKFTETSMLNLTGTNGEAEVMLYDPNPSCPEPQVGIQLDNADDRIEVYFTLPEMERLYDWLKGVLDK